VTLQSGIDPQAGTEPGNWSGSVRTRRDQAGQKRLLVIGARGFTGRHLVARLRATTDTTVVDAADHAMDLRSPDSIARALDATEPDMVINLAAVSSVDASDVRKLYETNAFGQLNLLQCLVQRGFVGRVVFASSANVYGDSTCDMIPEDRHPDPVNHYALSKQLAEGFCRLYADRCDIVVVRPFSCIGIGQGEHFLVPKIVRQFRERQPSIELGNLDVERDFIDIRDVARAYQLILTCPHPPTPIHIASGRTESIGGIIGMLQELSGHAIAVTVNPAFIRRNDLHHQQGDTAGLSSLGFAPRFSVRETLGWMLRS